MLKIHYGLRDDSVSLVDSYFYNNFEEKWLNDQLVKDMILDVDKSKVLSPYCIESPVLGQISPFMLSGGVKALILMCKTEFIINASMCGDNCAKWILKIGENKDLDIDLEHIMFFKDIDPNSFHAYFINEDIMLNSYGEYLDHLSLCQAERTSYERSLYNSN